MTLRLDPSVPRLRNKLAWRALQATFQLAISQGKFRITDFSLQNGHVHLIVEAVCALALTRGMQGFCISFAELIPGELIEPTGPPPTATPHTWLRGRGFLQMWGAISVDAMPRGTC